MSTLIFKDTSTVQFGLTTIDNNGDATFVQSTSTVTTMDKGDLTAKVKLVCQEAPDIYELTGSFNPSNDSHNGGSVATAGKAIWSHDLYFQYQADDGSWKNFNNHSSTSSITYFRIKPYQISGLYRANGTSFRSLEEDEEIEILQTPNGSPLEIGKYLGTLRSENQSIRVQVKTYYKDLDYKKFHEQHWGGSAGAAVTGWSGNGFTTAYLAGGGLGFSNSALALVGQANASGNYGYRVAECDTTFTFNDIEVSYEVQCVGPGGVYQDGQGVLDNAPENQSGQIETFAAQYKIGSNGEWSTAHLFTVNHMTANTFEVQNFRVHQNTKDPQPIYIRFQSRTATTGNSRYDVWLVDNVRVYTTNRYHDDDPNGSDNEVSTTGTHSYGSGRNTQTGVATGMWKWDDSYSDIYYENPYAPQGFASTFMTAEMVTLMQPAASGDIEPYFQIRNGAITQSRAVLLAAAKKQTNQFGVSTTIINNGVPMTVINYVEASRAAKIEIVFQNYNPLTTPPENAAKFEFDITAADVFQSINGWISAISSNYLTSESNGNRTWYLSGAPGSGTQRIEMQLDYLTVPDFWSSVQTYAVVNAYGQARNGDYYLVDSLIFVETAQPFNFQIDTNQAPYNYISAKPPGVDSYDININNLTLRTVNSNDKAYRYFWGVYKPPAGGNSGAWVNYGMVNGWSDTAPFDMKEGDQLMQAGSHWYTPNSPYNYYAAAGTTASNVPIDLDIHTVGWRDIPDSNTTNDDRQLSRDVWELKGDQRRGWDFNTQEGIASLVPGINFLMNTDQPNGLWEPSDMRIWADHQDAACHWFKIYVTYKNSDGSIIATDVKTITGTHATTNQLIQDSNGEYYRLVPADDFMPSSDVNARFTSIYNNKGYKLQIQIQALDNLNGVISSLNTGDIEASSLFGVPAFNVGATSAIEIDTNSSGNTATLKHIKPLYVRDGSVTQKAHYYRIDLYKNNSTSSSNLLAKYFKNYDPSLWVKNDGGYWSARWEVYQWTRANNIDQFVSGSGTYVNQIKIGEIPGWDSTYGSTTFLAQLRVLDDDGNFLTSQNKTAVFTPYQFSLHSDSDITEGTIDELAATPYYNIQTVIKPVTQSNNAFDYATLKVTNSSGAELNFTLPSNGNNIYFNQPSYLFMNDNTGSSLNVISLLNDDRYLTSGNSLSYEIKVWAYGYGAPSDQATAIASKTGQFSVGFWNFIFADAQIFIDRNTAEECRISLQFTPQAAVPETSQIAQKFRLRVWNGNATYASTAAGDKKEFTLLGSFFDNNQQARNTTSGGAYLDIQDVLSGSNRYNANDLNFQITAQKDDGTELTSVLGTFTVPMLTWTMGNVQAAIDSDTFNETVIVVEVNKVNATDSAPYMRNYISEEEVALGTPGGNEDYAWKQYDLVAEDSPLSKTSNSLADFFYWNIDTEGNNGAAINYIDKTRVTKLDVSARAVYYKDGQAFYTGNHSNRFMLDYTPWWDFHDQNSSVANVEHTLTNRIVNIDVQGLISSSQTQNPTDLRIDFERYDTNETTSLTKSFASSNVDGGSFNVIINSLYAGTVATSQHALAVRVTALTNGVEHIRSTGLSYMTKTINDMPAEPTVSINLHNTAAVVAANGDEYLYFDLTPEIDNSNFFTAGSEFTIVFEIDGNSQRLVIPGSMDNDRIVAFVPTGVNTFNGAIGSGAYDYKIYTEYTLARAGNALITGPLRQGTLDKVSHKFPKAGTMTSIAHGFNEQGVSQLSYTFSDPQAEYSSSPNRSAAYTVTANVEEKVLKSIDSNNEGEIKTETFTESQLDTNALDWDGRLTEAMYRSAITISVSEVYDNKHESVLPGDVGSTDIYVLDGYTGEFPNTVTNVVTYGPFEIDMNDISVQPNYGFSPSEGTIENFGGTYGLSGKRVKFKNITDFSNYYVNSDAFLGLGLIIEYASNSGNLQTDGKAIIYDTSSKNYRTLVTESKLGELESSIIAPIGDLVYDGEYYVLDFNIEYLSDHGWGDKPDLTQDFTYKLVAFSKEIVTKHDSSVIEISGSTDYSDISTWEGVALTPTEDVKSRIEAYQVSPQHIERVDVSTDSTVGKAISSYVYDKPDESYPYEGSSYLYLNKFTFLQDGATVTFEYDDYDSLSNQTASFSRVVDLNVDGYDPTKDLELVAEPFVTTLTEVGGNVVTSMYTSTRFFNRTNVNYSDKIIPSFMNLSVSENLNEDNTPEGSQTFDLKPFWIYNKNELTGVSAIFSLGQEWVKVTRQVRQGNTISSAVSPNYYHMYGASVTRTSHSNPEKNKFSITDSDVNINLYSGDGIDVTKPYIFEYEITPVFRYKASGSNSHTDVEVSSKTVTTSVVPDKFPIALNSVFDISNIYHKKNSVEVKWKYRYDQSMMTLASLGDAKVNFEIYSFVDETDADKALPSKFKPTKERIIRNKSSWKFIGKKPYVFQTEEDTITEHRFLVEYDKLESEHNLRIAILVTVESELFSSLSQTTGSAGASNSFALNVHTTDKELKENLFMPEEMDLTSMRYDRINLEFTKLNNLDQVPISVTRKKAKTRLSKKPYTSST